MPNDHERHGRITRSGATGRAGAPESQPAPRGGVAPCQRQHPAGPNLPPGRYAPAAADAPHAASRDAANPDTAAPGDAGREDRLELIRKIGVQLAELLLASSLVERAKVLIQLRILQDQIATIKHRNPAHGQRPSARAWIDTWSPPD